MKFLYIVSEFLPASSAVAVRSKFNVEALLDAGHEVTVLTGSNSVGIDGYDLSVTRVRPPSNKTGFITRLVREIHFGCALGYQILRSKNADHVVITSPPFFMMLICVIAAKMRRLPYTLDIRDRYPKVLFSLDVLKKSSFAGLVLTRLERWVYQGAEHVVTVTDGLVREIRQDTGKNPVLVMNGFDADLFEGLQMSRSRDECVKIIMHGTFGKFFDEDIFFRIVENIGSRSLNCVFVVIGDGAKMDMIRNRSLPNVVIYDQMSQKDIAAHLMVSHIGLSVHSTDESMKNAFPVKVFEYIGAGLPSVIIPENDGGRAVQDNGIGKTFSSLQWRDAAEFIACLIVDKDARAAISDGAYVKRMNYTRRHQARNFANLF